MKVHCRPATDADEPFLRHLIMESIAQDLAAWAWPDAIREQLLDMQYRVKRQGIAANYASAEVSVIEADGEPVGWMVVEPSDTDRHLVEIAILPESRGKGTGSEALRAVLDEADEEGLPVRLNVSVTNRAIGLYERLGFRRSGGNEVQHFMLYEKPVREPGSTAG